MNLSSALNYALEPVEISRSARQIFGERKVSEMLSILIQDA